MSNRTTGWVGLVAPVAPRVPAAWSCRQIHRIWAFRDPLSWEDSDKKFQRTKNGRQRDAKASDGSDRSIYPARSAWRDFWIRGGGGNPPARSRMRIFASEA